MRRFEGMGKKVIDVALKEDIKNQLEMTEEIMAKGVKLLYTTLLQFTKRDAKAKVTSSGMKGAWEAYRYIVNKGKNITMTAIMSKRMKVMNPDPAKSPGDVEAKLQAWKTDMRILLESGQEQDVKMTANQDQMITILISMLPDRLPEHIMTKYEVGTPRWTT